jgi:hypothetical protein
MKTKKLPQKTLPRTNSPKFSREYYATILIFTQDQDTQRGKEKS